MNRNPKILQNDIGDLILKWTVVLLLAFASFGIGAGIGMVIWLLSGGAF